MVIDLYGQVLLEIITQCPINVLTLLLSLFMNLYSVLSLQTVLNESHTFVCETPYNRNLW